MKKEDLVIGKWYFNPSWSITRAIKVSSTDTVQKDLVIISERICKDGTYIKRTGEGWSDTYDKYREVSISEIAQYLPKDHPDLQLPHTICEECQGGGRIMKAKLYPSGHHEEWETCIECSGAGYLEGQSDTILKEFPKIGYCKNPTDELVNYISKHFVKTAPTGVDGIIWDYPRYWICGELKNSSRPEYTIEQLNKFINPKIKQNEVSRTTSENRRATISGTITVRYRGQQGSVGSRPQGNKTSTREGRTLVVRAEKRGQVGFRSDS